jgi:hypothetical protein
MGALNSVFKNIYDNGDYKFYTIIYYIVAGLFSFCTTNNRDNMFYDTGI